MSEKIYTKTIFAFFIIYADGYQRSWEISEAEYEELSSILEGADFTSKELMVKTLAGRLHHFIAFGQTVGVEKRENMTA